MNIYIDELRNDYHNGKIIPFVGAGLSIPFNVPSWEDMIREMSINYSGEKPFIKDIVDADLASNDYWSAVDNIKKYAIIDEQEIQQQVTRLIRLKQKDPEDDTKHNYSDLSELNFNLYLTTNYDSFLQKYLEYELYPIELRNAKINAQEFLSEKRVCHLHGTVSNYGDIVLSKDSYRDLYDNKKYESLLKVVTGSKKLLFMGFSFDDQFLRTLIEQHKEYINSRHYILLNNPSDKRIRELREDYGLITISYDTGGSSHVAEIRKILKEISKPIPNSLEESSEKRVNDVDTRVIAGAGLKSFKRKLDGNLFYKKLKLEEVDETLIDLSSNFYVAADEYIREMKKEGMPIDVIDSILAQVLIEYKEIYIEIYKKYGDSEQFLKKVHDSLADIDFGRLEELIKVNISNKYENKGFIHILADNEKEDVWWGKERFDE